MLTLCLGDKYFKITLHLKIWNFCGLAKEVLIVFWMLAFIFRAVKF